MKKILSLHCLLFVCSLFTSTATLSASISQSAKTEHTAIDTKANNTTNINDTAKENIKTFINHMVKTYKLDQAQLETWLLNKTPDEKVLALISRPYEKAVSWSTYRDHFINKRHIDAGVSFWKSHQTVLKTAQRKYGIPAYIIVGILGVETNFGQVTMKFKALSSLTTLAFYYQPRAHFFKQELEEYLLLTHEHNIPPETLQSSYAGALGIPQFMPSCYRKFSTPYKKHTKADLVSNFNDAIFSVANYLIKRGHWKRNQPIIIPVSYKEPIDDKLLSTDAIPKHTLLNYKKRFNIQPIRKINPFRRAALIKIEDGTLPSYWFTFNNFHAILQYNSSTYYALSVYQLGKAIQNKVKEELNV